MIWGFSLKLEKFMTVHYADNPEDIKQIIAHSGNNMF